MAWDYQKSTRMMSEYGLTEEAFNQMLADQKGCCAICQEHLAKPCVDHCHTTGVVRGILCSNCNTGLGLFKDNIRLLAGAIVYLEEKTWGKLEPRLDS